MDDPSLIADLIGLLQAVPVLGPVLPYVPLICGMAAIADAVIPPPPAGSWAVVPRQIIHVLGLNVGYARNAVPAGAIPASVAQKTAEVRAVAADVATAAGELQQKATGNPEAADAPIAKNLG